MGRRGQISIEYIMILAFVFAILIPGVYFFYSYSQGSANAVTAAQYDKLGQQMVTTAMKTKAQGIGSWLTIDVSIPENVVDINVTASGEELVIYYDSPVGRTEAVFFPDDLLSVGPSDDPVPTEGSIFANEPHPGRASFRFTSGKELINITEIT